MVDLGCRATTLVDGQRLVVGRHRLSFNVGRPCLLRHLDVGRSVILCQSVDLG